MYIDQDGVLERYYDGEGDIILPAEVRVLGDELFLDRTDITGVGLCEGLEGIGNLAFCGSGITEIELPDSLEWIGVGTFARCPDLASVKLPVVMDSVSELAFYNCKKLENIELPLIVDEIEDEAFMGCTSLRQIRLPATLDAIGARSFAESGLEEIFIPSSVTRIGSEAFADCTDLRLITVDGAFVTVEEDAFPEEAIICAPYIPPEKLPERCRLMAAIGFMEWHGRHVPTCRTFEWQAFENGPMHYAGLCYRFYIRTHAKDLCRFAAERPKVAMRLVEEGIIPHELVEKLQGSTLDVVETLFAYITENFPDRCEIDGGPAL